MERCSVLCLFLIGALLAVSPVLGQQTRAERWREARQAKLDQVRPPRTSLVKKVARFVERTSRLVTDIETPRPPVIDGVQLVFGGLRSGAGTTAGLRLEPLQHLDRLHLTVEGRASTKRYWGAQTLAGYDGDRFYGYGYARYRHLPQEQFYGLGPDAPRDMRADFGLDEGIAGGLVGAQVNRKVFAGGHASYLVNRIYAGENDALPNIHDQFGPAQLPGIEADVDYLVLGGFAEVDTRDVERTHGYGSRFAPTEGHLRGLSLSAQRGLYLAAEVSQFRQIGAGHNDFMLLELEAQQFIPLRNGYQVLALRQYAALTETGGGNTVPFYLMPQLGGGDTIRGFNNGRFRGRNATLLNAEFRWQVWARLDLALFADAGHVFDRFEAWHLSDAEVTYGLGFRFRSSPQRIASRIDLGRSREGFVLMMKFGSFL